MAIIIDIFRNLVLVKNVTWEELFPVWDIVASIQNVAEEDDDTLADDLMAFPSPARMVFI